MGGRAGEVGWEGWQSQLGAWLSAALLGWGRNQGRRGTRAGRSSRARHVPPPFPSTPGSLLPVHEFCPFLGCSPPCAD